MNIKVADKFKKRVLMSVAGMLASGMSIGFFRDSVFGVDPFQSFVTGLHEIAPVSYGTVHMLISAALLLFVFFANRHYIHISTWINLFVVGYVAQFFSFLLSCIIPDPGMGVRILYLLIAVVVMCLGSSLYYTADLGVSPYDAVALILSDTWHIGKFRYVRSLCDLACVLMGTAFYLFAGNDFSALRAVVGVGTIITAFFMGSLIEFFNARVSRPFLEGRQLRGFVLKSA